MIYIYDVHAGIPSPIDDITIEISIYKGRKQLKCGIKSDYGESNVNVKRT